MKYLIFDTETGGVTTDQSLLEIAWGIYDDQSKQTTFGEYQVRPENGVYLVTAGALGVNNINLVEHDKRAVYQSEVGHRLLETVKHESLFGKNKLIPVGHNVAFDIGFVLKHLVDKKEWDQYVSYRVLDTAGIALFLQRLKLLPSDLKLSLESLANHFGINTNGNHRASKDVEMTIAVWQALENLGKGFNEF